MTFPSTMRCPSLLGLIVIAGLLATGCVIRDPQALVDIGQARTAIDAAQKANASQRYPEDYAALERRYAEARGVFYACRDDEASRLAKALIADANALAVRRPVAAAPTPPPPANRPPSARLLAQTECDINAVLSLSGEGSSDPDGDPLTYTWDFGDGTPPVSAPSPTVTHRYAQIGNYPVRLTVSDGRGGTDMASRTVACGRREVIQSDVLFDFDKSTLKPQATQTLASIVQQLKNDPSLRADIVGHTDSVGTEQYNMGLSERRAKAVAAHMVQNGIAANRLNVSWKGETQPVAPNTTADGRAQNRRVDITVKPAAQM
jgi:outer membrane protein OmpA-like peptidoglycan-associated protein